MGNAKNICYDVFLKDFGPESERTPGWARYCNSNLFGGNVFLKRMIYRLRQMYRHVSDKEEENYMCLVEDSCYLVKTFKWSKGILCVEIHVA